MQPMQQANAINQCKQTHICNQCRRAGGRILQRVKCSKAALLTDDARVVRASLAVIRAFVVEEEVRDELGFLSDGAYQCIPWDLHPQGKREAHLCQNRQIGAD